jgi:hypothetical protein
MAYIGKQPVVGNFVKLDAIVTSATTTFNLLNGGVAYSPQSANNCIVSLNGIIQEPTSSGNVGGYTISGSTIVFTSALTTLDVIDFILVLGDVLSVGTPTDNTITTAKLASGLVVPVGKGGTGLTALGTANQVLRTNSGATALEFGTVSSGFTSGTAVATTSGTAFDFTGIPATAKLIIINFHEVSLSGGNNLFVQLGDSGGFETSGYIASAGSFGASSAYNDETTAFHITGWTSSSVYTAIMFLTLVDISTNTWISSHSGKVDTTTISGGGGSKSLSDILTQVRITRSGVNTFDAGKLNILYI